MDDSRRRFTNRKLRVHQLPSNAERNAREHGADGGRRSKVNADATDRVSETRE